MPEIKKLSEIRDLQVMLVSLVDKGANQRSLIWKSKGVGADNHNIVRDLVLKVDEAEHRVYCIVYTPDEEDAHGDYMTAKEIQKACDNFMKLSKTNSIDEQHNMEVADGVWIVENWIVKEGDKFFGDDVGAWAMGLKIENDDVWAKVIKGEYTGLSLYGLGNKIDKSKKSAFSKFMNAVEKAFEGLSEEDDAVRIQKELDSEKIVKDFNSIYDKNKVRNAVEAMSCAIFDVVYAWDSPPVADADKVTQLIECCDQFVSKIKEFEVAEGIVKEYKKAGKVLSDANLTKLQTAIDSLQSIYEAASNFEEKKKSLKEKFSKTITPGGDSEMTKEEIQKAIDDSVEEKMKPVLEKNDELTEQLKTANEKITTLEQKSNGSKQETDTETETKKEDKTTFGFAKGLFPPKDSE